MLECQLQQRVHLQKGTDEPRKISLQSAKQVQVSALQSHVKREGQHLQAHQGKAR